MAGPGRQRFFEETPAGLRRLVLLLYALVLPPFVVVLAATAVPARRAPAVEAVLALCGAAGAWVFVRRSPGPLSWILPAGVAPTVSCGIAFAATGATGLGFIAVLSAPLAWAAVLFDGPVVVAAWVTGTITCLVVQTERHGVLAGLASAAVFAGIQGLVAWVVHGKTTRHREARLRSLERQLNDVELLLRRDGVIVDANDRAVETYGHPRDALIGMRLPGLGPAQDAPRIELQLRLAVERGGVVFETVHLRRDGSSFPVEVSARPCLLRGERYFHAVVRDVSARRAAEAQRWFVAALFAHMQEAVVVLDDALRVKLWSPGAERILGWTATEATGRSVFGLFVPEAEAGEVTRAIAAAAAGEPCTRLVRRRRKDGHEITLSMSLVALRDGTDAITGVMGVARDVTAQQAAEHALRESEERLAQALSASDTEIWEWDVSDERVRVGPGWPALLSTPTPEAGGDRIRDVLGSVHPDDREAVRAAAREHLEGRTESLAAEARVRLVDGSTRWASVRGRVVARGPDGAPTRLVGTIRDVTARRLLDEERKRLLIEAQRATRAREQILAIVAHDLRSPLAAISSMASGLESAADGPDARADLLERSEIIQGASARMGHLIEDLLDVAAIQSGSLRLSPADHDPAEIAREAARVAAPLARRARVAIELPLRDPLPPTLRCDRVRLLQVLGNLLSNAIQATPADGTVTIRVAAEPGVLCFSVRDTGRGFEAGQAERLFQPYQRGAGSTYKGTGLGLAICRGIVEGHGGRIHAERLPEGGAAFHFTIPRTPTDGAPRAARAAA